MQFGITKKPCKYIPALLNRTINVMSHSTHDKAQAGKVNISYSFAGDYLTLHEPVVLSFAVENGLAQPINFGLGQDREQGFLFTVQRPDGLSVRLPQLHHEGISVLSPEVLVESGQTYTQKLLLNARFDFAIPGKYEIEVQLANPIQTQDGTNVADATEFHTSLEIKPRDPEQLKQVCANLIKRLNASTSYEEAAEAANELSYIKDPIAIPYLKEALMSKQMVELIAVKGLERIGSDEAVEALTSAQKSQSRETVEELIKPALARIKNQPKHTNKEQNLKP